MVYANARYAPGSGERATRAGRAVALQRVSNYSTPILELGGTYFATDLRRRRRLVDLILRNPNERLGPHLPARERLQPVNALRRHPHLSIGGAEAWVHRTSTQWGGDDYWYAFAGNPHRTPAGAVLPPTGPVDAAPRRRRSQCHRRSRERGQLRARRARRVRRDGRELPRRPRRRRSCRRPRWAGPPRHAVGGAGADRGRARPPATRNDHGRRRVRGRVGRRPRGTARRTPRAASCSGWPARAAMQRQRRSAPIRSRPGSASPTSRPGAASPTRWPASRPPAVTARPSSSPRAPRSRPRPPPS